MKAALFLRTALACGLAAWPEGGAAETLRLALKPGTPARLVIDSPLDDTNFQDPIGYNERGRAQHHFNHRITLTNTGTVPLTGRLLVVNGRDWSSAESLRAALRLPAGPRELVPRLFTFWRSHISHADSDTEAGQHPHALLHFWGYALCGDNTTAFARLLHGFGVPARKVPLNGHVANEYFYDGGWHFFDGDQNVFHLRLDNRTPASAEDLRADPLLARRTKCFGPGAAMDAVAAAFNTSLFEHIEPREQPPIRQKGATALLPAETLHPGEKLIYHRTRAPEKPVGKKTLAAWTGAREEALGVIELTLNHAARRTPGGDLAVRTAFPIIEIVNQTTGERFPVAAGEPVFQATVRPRTAADRISVFCQGARAALPVFSKGENVAALHAEQAAGEALVEIEIEPPASHTAPRVTVQNATPEGGAPEFEVVSEAGVDRLWWQIATEPEFTVVAPNLDTMTRPVPKLVFDPLTATFFNRDEDYFLRMKARRGGVWGEWSPPLKFTVDKPARPAPVSVATRDGKLQLTWPEAGRGAEYLVFGSNRRDFLPEPFAAEEIVAMRDQRIAQTRPNKNLVATVTSPTVELTPAFRFYRVIARRGDLLSVPGELVVTPRELAASLPPPTILQTRWTRVPDVAAGDGYRDAYLTQETPLPR